MRYIGNKTKLLEFIAETLQRRGITGGTAVDPFCGTASVSAELKRRGFRVVASDIMEYAYVLAHACVQVAEPPRFPQLQQELGSGDDSLSTVISFLNTIAPAGDFLHEHYTPDGLAGRAHGRMYFTPDNGARIDAIRHQLTTWRAQGLLDDNAWYVLLAALLEAADRVANTTGVYAAFVKSWQPNATRPLELRPPALVPGKGCHARRINALTLVAELEPFDLLYLDPPYNARQYAGYYHIPELIARGWSADTRTRGKTGLIDDRDKRSDWSRRQRCEEVFERLVATARWRHLVMSYNAEGIIPESTIERVLRAHGRGRTYKRYPITYKRYRSDADSETRRYRGDSVTEHLYCVKR